MYNKIMNVFIAGTMSRPYVFMDLFLAGGISGNIRKQWMLLASKINEQCKSISQEKTESGELLNLNAGGIMNLYLAGEHPVKNGRIAMNGGGSTLSLSHTIIAEKTALFLP